MLLETHLGHKSLKWAHIERLDRMQDCLPPRSLSLWIYIYIYFLFFSFTRQSTSKHFPLWTSDILSPSPSTHFWKMCEITFAALDWPQKIFGGSCYAFRRNYCWPFLQKNSSYLGISCWVCPADWNLGPPITESQQLLVCVSVYHQSGSFQKLLESFLFVFF